ncbi:MAG: sugar phosphate isomerase/epimerase [Isosphaeraceae bacterium]
MSEFIYCLNTSTIQPTPLLDKVRIAGQAGYQALEPWNDEINQYIEHGGSLADLKSALTDAGLAVASVVALRGWADSEGEAFAEALEDCRRLMDQAAFLESPHVVASPPEGRVNLEQTTRRYAQLLHLGRQVGVKPAMEFLGFSEGVNTLAQALAIAEGTEDPDASVVADVFHLMRGPGSIDDLLTLSSDRLAIVHVNDLPRSPAPGEQTDADRILPGDGIADLPCVIAHLRSIGYQGALSLELFNRDLWAQDPAEVAVRGLDRLRALVEG